MLPQHFVALTPLYSIDLPAPFIVLEYMPGGEVKWTTQNNKRPTNTVANTRSIFRDVVLGLDYRSSVSLSPLTAVNLTPFCQYITKG